MPVPWIAVNGGQRSDVCHLTIQSSSILAAFISATYLYSCLSRTTHDSTLPALLWLCTCSPSLCPGSTHVCVRCRRSSDDQPNCEFHVCRRYPCLSSKAAAQERDELLELRNSSIPPATLSRSGCSTSLDRIHERQSAGAGYLRPFSTHQRRASHEAQRHKAIPKPRRGL